VPAKLAGLSAAVAAADAETLTMEAHAFKGMVANFGCQRAQALALELENLGRSGPLAAAPPILARLVLEMDLVRAFLASRPWEQDASTPCPENTHAHPDR